MNYHYLQVELKLTCGHWFVNARHTIHPTFRKHNEVDICKLNSSCWYNTDRWMPVHTLGYFIMVTSCPQTSPCDVSTQTSTWISTACTLQLGDWGCSPVINHTRDSLQRKCWTERYTCALIFFFFIAHEGEHTNLSLQMLMLTTQQACMPARTSVHCSDLSAIRNVTAVCVRLSSHLCWAARYHIGR